MPTLEARRDRTTVAALFFAATALYLALRFTAPFISYDGLVYRELARNIPVSGYTFLGVPHAKFLPLYPGLMTALNLVTGGALGVEQWGLLISLLSGAALPPLIFLFARRLGAEPRWALTAALVQLIAPVGLDLYRDINVMPLFTLELLGAWLLSASGRHSWAGVALGLAATTRYEAYFMLPVIALADRREPRRLLRFGLGFALAAAPWLVRNLLLHGHLVHSKYFVESRYLLFHLHEIAIGLFWEAGPLVVVAGAIGFRRLHREWRLQLGGFALIYIVVHTFWWWYKNRFLLPLMPLLLAPAGLGLVGAEARLSKRVSPRAARALLIAGIFLPLIIRSGFFVREAYFTPPDPFRAAGQSLAAKPDGGALIGGNAFLLYADSGRMAYTWEELKEDEDPNALVLRHYLEHGARQVVWANWGGTDLKRYGFLAEGMPRFAEVKRPDGRWKLSYTPAGEFFAPPKKAIIYDLAAVKLE